MRIALTVLFVIHGALHLLGFLKAWGLAALPQMNGRTIILHGAVAEERATLLADVVTMPGALVCAGSSTL